MHMQALALPEKVCVAASQLLLSMFLFLRCRCALRCAEQVHLHFAACSDTFAAVCADVGSPAWRPCRYCECYQHGQPCHSRCTCADCGNNGQLTLSGEVSLGGLGCKCFGLPAPQGTAQTAVCACVPHACALAKQHSMVQYADCPGLGWDAQSPSSASPTPAAAAAAGTVVGCLCD